MVADKSLAAEIEAVRGRLHHLMSQAHEQEKRHARGGRHNAAAACASRKRALHDALKIVGACHASPAFAPPSPNRRRAMLSVRVYINRREIARADAINCSDLGSLSNYACSAHSEPSPVTGEPQRLHGFAVEGHEREQSAWALVAKMATRIAELEATTTEDKGREDRG